MEKSVRTGFERVGREADSLQGCMKETPSSAARPKPAGRATRRALVWRGLLVLALFLVLGMNIDARPRPTQPPWPSPGQIYHEGFDQPLYMPTNQTPDPSVWTESWSGYALNRSSQIRRVTPWTVPMLASNGTWNLDPERGALRMFYRPEYTSGRGPGHLARLLTLVSGQGRETAVWWTLAVSADGSCLQLLCETPNGHSTCMSAGVAFRAGDWEMLTLGYTETNTALFVGDQQVASGDGLLTVPREVAPFTRLIIGSGFSGELAAGQIEEFSAFTGRNMVRQGSSSPFGIDPLWEIQGCWARLFPLAQLGPITPQEEAATRERVLARRAALASQQATAQDSMFSQSLVSMEGSGMYWPLSGDTNGFWLSPPVIDGTNVVLTLFNADTNKAYEVYYNDTPLLLNSNAIWPTLCVTGRLGQINFTNPITASVRFYRAAEGSDWDGDGIPNSMDADPRSTNVGALTITIESPTNGSVVQ